MAGVYCYDGTFAGLLTLLAKTMQGRCLPESVSVTVPQQQNLFDNPAAIETDHELAVEYWTELTGRLSPLSLQLLRQAFYGNHPERELLVCRYLLLALQEGRKVNMMLAHPHVAPLRKLAQQVGREAHRYLGFVRFRETTGGFYYAAISPDHRVLPLIANHFAARFRDQQWVIHDIRHGEGVIHDCQQRKWLLLPMECHAEPELTPAEEQFKALWRSYFAALAITERENLSLQQSKVPLKVRPWLVEFGE